jgi:hypothetical protein
MLRLLGFRGKIVFLGFLGDVVPKPAEKCRRRKPPPSSRTAASRR